MRKFHWAFTTQSVVKKSDIILLDSSLNNHLFLGNLKISLKTWSKMQKNAGYPHFLLFQFSPCCPARMAQYWVCRTHDLVVVSSIPIWGELSFRHIFTSHLCRSMRGKVVGDFGKKSCVSTALRSIKANGCERLQTFANSPSNFDCWRRMFATNFQTDFEMVRELTKMVDRC